MAYSSDISAEIKQQIEAAISDATVEVSLGSERHYEISVVSASFEGQSRLEQQRRIYASITELMSGDAAPIHAIDRLDTRAA